MPLVLASASPRRAELLRAAGIEFERRPADVNETRLENELPANYVARIANEKARAVWRPGDRTLGADTVVVVDGDVLGKPIDSADANRMLARLSGRAHEVLTGVALFDGSSARVVTERTVVRFRDLTDAEIDEYVATGEPADKAGAYGIQGGASKFVERIEGCYFNVVGLPVSKVYGMLR